MLIPNHPDDEQLSALAARDPDTAADSALVAHVDTCARCTALVDELDALRASLAELPDLPPSRPLRLLPEVAEEPSMADRIGGWTRRFFAPVVTAGAALAIVGVIGTVTPSLGPTGGVGVGSEPFTAENDEGRQGGDAGSALDGAGEEEAAASAAPAPAASAAAAPAASDDGGIAAFGEDGEGRDSSADPVTLPAERSPWPMVLFTGVALILGAVLLRWVLSPRAP